MEIYWRYFVAGGNYFMLFVVLIFFILGETGILLTDWWLSDWASCSEYSIFTNITGDMAIDIPQTCSISRNNRINIYGTLIFSTVLLNFLRGVLFYLVCISASRVIHNKMVATILRTPVLFFDSNPSGRILNRFSKDIGFVDDILPTSFFVFLVLLLRFISIIILQSIANPYILIVLPFAILAFLVLRWYYLATSRDIKRLEALARSPVYSHISTTLQGLPTISVLGHQQTSLKQFHNFNNEHTKGWYLYLVTTRWFAIRLDFISNLILAAFVSFSVPLIAHTDIQFNPALLGLGLTYAIALARLFQFCIRQSAEVENLMISTERIMAYSSLKPEASLETLPSYHKPPETWPDKGELSMEDVAFQYSSSHPLVLKHIDFSVRPSERVGIVGRTGAGKSSLISVLFRLAEPIGHINIDGVDTKSIGLHDLRKKMSIIPQDPVLFSGTMRYNLDPFEEYSDLELWEVLEQVQMKGAVEEIEGQLSGEMSEGGRNFSVGQRQLVCLARALLRKNTILILDEATAYVDYKTDEIIQQAIREKFVGCTVLTIAHRLNTIMDSDRILVMSNGKVKEFASPYQLLQNSNSRFYKMVEMTGPEASQKLHLLATAAKYKVGSKFSVL